MSQDGHVDGAKGREPSPGSDDAVELGTKEKPREKSKFKGKVIRVLTVLAYVLSVSLAAIMLSLYYVFLWEPKLPSGGTASIGRLQGTEDLEVGGGDPILPLARLAPLCLNASGNDSGAGGGGSAEPAL